ncbi:MAG: enoyl-CoA hydratase [Bauldia sp.]|nr:MAG: enoyl-CoA hydratase [Bauldia sp.]
MKKSPTPAREGNDPPVLIERRAAVALLTLNRPEKLNTLSEAMLAALTAAIRDLSADGTIAALVICARGKAFSAGHDLRELTARRGDPDGGKAYFADIMRRCARLMQAIVASPKPVIAAVEATAVAAGCQLVATCDLAVAAKEARFGTTGINNGLFCSTPMVPLSRNVPQKRALEMLMLGGLISAEDAERYGLVNRVVPQSEVIPTAITMAEIIASKSKAAIALGKRAFYQQLERGLEGAYGLTGETMACNLGLPDAAEGIDAFLGKRAPVWQSP